MKYLADGLDRCELLKPVPERTSGETEGEGIEEQCIASVPHMVAWLWEHAGAAEPAFRTKALTAFLALVPLLPPASNTSSSSSSKRHHSVKPEPPSSPGEKAPTPTPLPLAVRAQPAARAWVLARGQAEVLRAVEGPAAALLAQEELPPGLLFSPFPPPPQADGGDGGGKGTRGSSSPSSPPTGGAAIASAVKPSADAFRQTLGALSASLDVYLWLFDRGILRPAAFLEGTEAFTGGSSGDGTTILACIHTALVGIWDQAPPRPGGYEALLGLAPTEARALRRQAAGALNKALALLASALDDALRSSSPSPSPSSSSSSSASASEEAVASRLARRIAGAGLWGVEMHRVLVWALLCPWGLHNSSAKAADGPLNRPEEDKVVALQLPNTTRRLLRHWRLLDAAAAAAAGEEGGHGHGHGYRRRRHQQHPPQPFAHTLHALLAASGAPLDPTTLPIGLFPTPSPSTGRGTGGADTEAKAWLVQGISALNAAGLLSWALVGGAHAPSKTRGDAAVHTLATTLFTRLALPPVPGSPPPTPAARRLAGSVLFLAITLGLPLTPPDGDSASPSLLGALIDARSCYPSSSGAGPTRGEAFQRRFVAECAEALVVAESGRVCLVRLMQQGQGDVGGQRRVQGLVLGVLDWLLTRPAMLDNETQAVLRIAIGADSALLPSDPKGLGQDDALAMRALTAFGRLLRLDASLPRGMRVGVGKDARVRGAVAALLRGQGERVWLKKEAIGLLPFILAPGVGGGGAEDEEYVGVRFGAVC